MVTGYKWVFRAAFLFVIVLLGIKWIDGGTTQQTVDGIIQNKEYHAKECSMVPVYDAALNTTVPQELCNGPYWVVTMHDKHFKVSEVLYDKLDIGSHYTFSYAPMTGLSLAKGD